MTFEFSRKGDHAMAKEKEKTSKDGSPEGKVNKSEEIRAAFRENPKASANEVITKLKEKGIKVGAPLVYFVKKKMKGQKRRVAREKAVEAGVVNPVKLVLGIRSLAQEAGGIGNLKKIVDAMAE